MVVFLGNFGIIRTVVTKRVKQTCTITYIRAALSFHELFGLFVETLISEWTGIFECNSTTAINIDCKLPVSIVLRVASQIVVVVVVAWIGAISGPW